MPHRRRSRFAIRRRIEDEGEEDGSFCGDLEDDSLSDDTMSSHPDDDCDGEGSDVTEQELHEGSGHGDGRLPKNPHSASLPAKEGKSASRTKNPFDNRVSETEAMLNGMKLTEESEKLEELHFDDLKESLEDAVTTSNGQGKGKTSKRENHVEKIGREHEQYLKERDQNPAYVPTRGGFSHGKRSTNSPPNAHWNSNHRSKSKPHGLIVDSNAPRRSMQKPDVTDGPWKHDLHETVAWNTPPPVSGPPSSSYTNPPAVGDAGPVPTAPRSSPPNRSFSTTVLIGNVPVVVFLPGMKSPVSFPAVPKRQHTRLPQHRPPLRRDKPVRISLPGQQPRYIFPATERSFIFIPRALRPNQQHRGRGRGGFFGARRSSVYGGSVYAPSLSMSRRSSVARVVAGSGIGSPAASIISRTALVPGEGGKPIVRLPPNVQPPPTNVPQSNYAPPLPSGYPPPPPAPAPENKAPPAMHQPRPQKTVSVADIESPVVFHSPQTQEQPFHQQMPAPVSGQGFGPDSSAYPPHTRNASLPQPATTTPLSQIPEQAIHAAPFQPVSYPQQPPYYPTPIYAPGPVAYPAEYPVYGAPGPVPVFVPQGQPMPYGMAPGEVLPSGTVAHESNGTVYYYDASQFANGQYPQAPYPAPPHMMAPPGSTYYYPQPGYYT
ncbi:hypothetical protein VTO42DRAFT_7039 [Malbranchea cinnamomea]